MILFEKFPKWQKFVFLKTICFSRKNTSFFRPEARDILQGTHLKKTSVLCGIVGAFPGALPPVIGWAAVDPNLGIKAALLFSIMFLWQMPHSLAIAWLYREDYTRAGFQLLPVIEPDGQSTGRQVVTYSLALLVVSLLPTQIGMAGNRYFVIAFGLGCMLLWYSVQLARLRSTHSARQLMFASLVYLPILLCGMALDKLHP